MILNGVCVIWRGWIDLQRLDGMGYLEYDDERAQVTEHTCAHSIQYLREWKEIYIKLCPQLLPVSHCLCLVLRIDTTDAHLFAPTCFVVA